MTDISINETNSLFNIILQIINKHEEISSVTGGNFNVFKLLNLQSNEVRTHSSLLGDLLNAEGSHGQGDTFLRLFIKQLDIEGFDSINSKAFVEEYIGPLNTDRTSGGRVDILIKDTNDKHIIIENKVDAADQEGQLLRYHNYDPNGYLFYLTLDGREPSEVSTSGKLSKNDYSVISYRKDILAWLSNCIRESASLPIIRETITQYVILLKEITNQMTNNATSRELIQLIEHSPNFSRAIVEGYSSLEQIVANVRSRIFNHVTERLNSNIPLEHGDTLRITLGEDSDGVYIGYEAIDEDGNKLSSDSERVKRYTEILSNCSTQNMHPGGHWLCWWNPPPFPRYMRFKPNSLSSHGLLATVVQLHGSEVKFNEFLDAFLQRENIVRKSFLERLQDY